MNAAQLIQGMMQRMKLLEQEVADLEGTRGVFAARTLEEIPGKREVFFVPINIAVTNAGGTTVVTGTYTHSQSSLFVVEQIGAAWRETSDAVFRPTSSVMNNLVATPVVDAIDFLWGIIEDDKFNWQSNRLPSPLLFTNQERPLYLPISGQVRPNSTLKVEVEPIIAADNDGTLTIVLGGYLLMDPPPFLL